MTTVRGVKTIGKFKIRMFIAGYFAKGSVKAEVTERNDAIIYDRYGDEMGITYDMENDKIVCYEGDEIIWME